MSWPSSIKDGCVVDTCKGTRKVANWSGFTYLQRSKSIDIDLCIFGKLYPYRFRYTNLHEGNVGKVGLTLILSSAGQIYTNLFTKKIKK